MTLIDSSTRRAHALAIPALLLAKQIIMEAIDKIVLGLIIAALYRPPRSAVISD